MKKRMKRRKMISKDTIAIFTAMLLGEHTIRINKDGSFTNIYTYEGIRVEKSC